MALLLLLCGLTACGRGDEGNPFLRPYVRPPLDMDGDMTGPDLAVYDPFAPGRLACERDGESCLLAGASGICVANTCRLVACLEGRGDCDGNPNNGCEVDLTRAESCGSCATPCSEEQLCQKGRLGYTCAVGVLCPQGSFDLDARSATGCEWSERSSASTLPQPRAQFAIVQRVALTADDASGDAWRGVLTGFDAMGRRAALMASQSAQTPFTVAELDVPFAGVSRSLDVRTRQITLQAFDVWNDAAYLYEGEGDVLDFALQCAPRSRDDSPTTQPLQGGALSDQWTAELTSTHMFMPLDVCELPSGEEPQVLTRALCPDEARAFGPADYLRWFYPYASVSSLENRGAHAPVAHQLSAGEVDACTQCALDVTTGSFAAPRGCFASTQCAPGTQPLECGQTCVATGCPDFELMHVVRSMASARHYVVTKRGVVVMRDDGQIWVPLARQEERWDPSIISGASFIRAAVTRHGTFERLFLLHNQGFVRVLDVSLQEPVTLRPAHPDIPIALGDLDERGPIAFLASDPYTLFFADVYESQLIHLNGLDHARQAFTFEQDVPGNGWFGASVRQDDVAVYRMEFGVLSTLLLKQ